MRHPPRTGARTVKRLLDLALAVPGLVAAAPLLAVLALLVRRDVGPPVLFRQQRPGLHGTPFTLIKLRTMRHPTRPDQPDAERLTGLGRWLRATSLDELPSLWNVVRGDMSLVGPRPLLVEYLDLYTPDQARRHEMRPGLTGLAQVAGRNAVSWEERLALDTHYVDRWTLRTDARILLRTVALVLSRRGVTAPGEATMPRYGGTA